MTMNRDALLHAAKAAAAVAKNASTPEAGCVLVDAVCDSATFSATDFDRSIRHEDFAMVEEEGKALVSARALERMVKSLPEGAVTLESGTGYARVSGGKSTFEVPALDPREWPGSPSDGEGPKCSIDSATLLAMAKRVAPFCAKDDPRASLNGVHVVSGDGKLRMEATDAVKTVRCWQPCDGEPFSAVVPPEFLVGAADVMHGMVDIMSDGNRLRVECDTTEMSTREIGAKFPALDRVWPKDRGYELTLSTDDVRNAVTRACMVGDGKLMAHLVAHGGKLSITCREEGAGAFSEEVACDGEMDVYAATHVLKASFEALDTIEAHMYGQSATKPIVVEGGSVDALVMPMRPTGGD